MNSAGYRCIQILRDGEHNELAHDSIHTHIFINTMYNKYIFHDEESEFHDVVI